MLTSKSYKVNNTFQFMKDQNPNIYFASVYKFFTRLLCFRYY